MSNDKDKPLKEKLENQRKTEAERVEKEKKAALLKQQQEKEDRDKRAASRDSGKNSKLTEGSKSKTTLTVVETLKNSAKPKAIDQGTRNQPLGKNKEEVPNKEGLEITVHSKQSTETKDEEQITDPSSPEIEDSFASVSSGTVLDTEEITTLKEILETSQEHSETSPEYIDRNQTILISNDLTMTTLEQLADKVATMETALAKVSPNGSSNPQTSAGETITE